MLTRRGTSLIELLIALALAAIILASATGSLLRQQRNTSRLALAAQGEVQARVAASLLPAQLALGSPSTDDLVPGSLSDTALQLRVAIATGISCDSARAPAFVVGDTGLEADATVSAPRTGDSLWRYRASAGVWSGRAITGVIADSLRCGPVGDAGSAAPMRAVLRVETGDSTATLPLVPLRVTRQQRLVIYRAGDGTWQLGLREWSEETHVMSAPQPVAGPFQVSAANGVRTGFRYFDAAGASVSALDTARATIARVARIRFTAVTTSSLLPLGGAPVRDSADIVVQHSSP